MAENRNCRLSVKVSHRILRKSVRRGVRG
jgi:hypothetical protein